MNNLEKIHNLIMYSNSIAKITSIYRRYFEIRRNKFGYFDKQARVRYPIRIKGIENVFLYERTHILSGALIIAIGAKFIMKKNSGAAEGLTVVTENHNIFVGEWFLDKANSNKYIDAKDVVIEEDVWIATNVTLLMGVVVGRGAIVGAGAVCRNSIPPYAIVIGNPAKVIGFKFTPEEIIEHEKILYPNEERIQFEVLKENYEKYFINRINNIKQFLK